MSLLKLAWKNTWFKPWNAVLSLLLFALGTGLIAFIFILNRQIQGQFDRNMAGVDLVIGAKGSPLQLVLSSMYHLDVPTGNIGINEAAPFINPQHPLIGLAVPLSLGDSHRGYRIVGTTHEILEFYDGMIAEGELWEKSMEVTVGAQVARRLDLAIGDEFQSAHGFQDEEELLHDHGDGFRVVGLLKPTGSVLDQLILTNTHSIWDVHASHGPVAGNEEHDHGHTEQDTLVSGEAHGTDRAHLLKHPGEEITALLVQFKSNKNFQALNMLRGINDNTDLMAASPSLELSKLYNQIGIGITVLEWLGWIIAVVSGLSVFFSLTASLKDRQYELALMRNWGAGRRKLFSLILLEGMLLAALGYLVGEILAHGGIYLLNGLAVESMVYQFDPWTFISPEAWLFAGALIIGVAAAAFPAIRAARVEIAEVLR